MSRPSEKPPTIKISFVNGDGTNAGSKTLDIAPQLPPLEDDLKDAEWSEQETVNRFKNCLTSKNDRGMEVAMRAMTRLNCWPKAIDSLRSGPSPNPELGDALLNFWLTYGLHSIPQALKANLHHLIDAFRYLLPPYAGPNVMLYRGELKERHEADIWGISWTSKLDVAEMFARRKGPNEGSGIVLRLLAKPHMIVVNVGAYTNRTATLGEHEFLVDPREINSAILTYGLSMRLSGTENRHKADCC